jgi:hypothetical protein
MMSADGVLSNLSGVCYGASRVLRPVLSDMFINVMIYKLMRLHDELSRRRAGLTYKKNFN